MSMLLATALVVLSGYCFEGRVTGYVRSEYGPLTYDGTPIGTDEAIAAASWDIPIDSSVEIDGLGSYRIADRGMLGSSGWVDVAVWSRPEAYAATGVRRMCVYPPGASPR
jgi:3D (Asp-Asp-Asp) domain-containing protein